MLEDDAIRECPACVNTDAHKRSHFTGVRSQKSGVRRLAVILSLLDVILSAAKDLRSCFLDSAAYDELQRCFAPLGMTAFILTPDF